MTDTYAVYLYFNKLKDCTHVCCWSHVRRIFVSASCDYKEALAREFYRFDKSVICRGRESSLGSLGERNRHV